MDKIIIKDLEVFANHGVTKEERELGQKFVVSAILYLNVRDVAKSDAIEETVDYGKVCFRINRFLTEHTYRLVETAAEEMVKELLYTIPQLQWVDFEIKKPQAPIGLPLDYVSVSISRGWHEAIIALGSNMGDRQAYVKHGVSALQQLKDCRVISVSKIIETMPYGVLEQADFLNGCMKIQTLLFPEELLDVLHDIEHSVNRVKEGKWGPRTLDLDIIFYDNEIIDTAELKIPHVDMHNRDFVLEPLAQIAPNYYHPVFHKTVSILLDELEQRIKDGAAIKTVRSV